MKPVPDYLLDDPQEVCACGNWARVGKRVCYECDDDLKDLYADMRVEDAKEGKP